MNEYSLMELWSYGVLDMLYSLRQSEPDYMALCGSVETSETGDEQHILIMVNGHAQFRTGSRSRNLKGVESAWDSIASNGSQNLSSHSTGSSR